MSEIGALVLVFLIFVVPTVALYLAIGRETSEATVVNRSEAEQIAQERGGRPDAHKQNRETQDGHDSGEWGSTDEWGDRDRR